VAATPLPGAVPLGPCGCLWRSLAYADLIIFFLEEVLVLCGRRRRIGGQ
jgi:hypothetical protein